MQYSSISHKYNNYPKTYRKFNFDNKYEYNDENNYGENYISKYNEKYEKNDKKKNKPFTQRNYKYPLLYTPEPQQNPYKKLNPNPNPYHHHQAHENPYTNLASFQSPPQMQIQMQPLNTKSADTFNGFKIPDTITMTQRLLTFGMDMDLQHHQRQFGCIKQQEVFGMGLYFCLEDMRGSIVAWIKSKMVTVGYDYQVFACNGNRIGTITDQVLDSLFDFSRKYTIRDSNNIIIGTIQEQKTTIKPAIEVFNAKGKLEARFEEEVFTLFREVWNLKFYQSGIDRRLVIFFPAINSRRQSSKK